MAREPDEDEAPHIPEGTHVRPEPGLTAPLDEVGEEEKDIEPAGVMPGAGPDDARKTSDARDVDEPMGEGDPAGS